MSKKGDVLTFNEDTTTAYGLKSDYENADEFLNEVQSFIESEYDSEGRENLTYSEVKVVSMLITDEELHPDYAYPMDNISICIEPYYTVDIDW